MVSTTSVPDGVLRGAESVTVPVELFPFSTGKVLGYVEGKSLLLVTRIVRVVSSPLFVTEKGKEKGVPGTMMLLELAYNKKNKYKEEILLLTTFSKMETFLLVLAP